MESVQKGILAEEGTKLARYLMFSLDAYIDIEKTLQILSENIDTKNTVIGFGQSLIQALGKELDGLSVFEAQTSQGIDVPSTPTALWCWLRGDDRGELFHRSRQIETLLAPAFVLNDVVDSFQYETNRDLSGYEDGTENPTGDEAIKTAIVQGQGEGLDGGSFVAVQQWLHDFEAFDTMSTDKQDDTIGRHISDNAEFDSAPESAHVKRSAQENFEPEAFILRRSMPWAEDMQGGLMFVAFGHSFAAFEAIQNKMLGKGNGVVDGLYSFTRPITGTYYWCPPIKDDKLDLSRLEI